MLCLTLIAADLGLYKMGNVKFLVDNFIDPDVVSNSAVSSEQAAFPVSNIYNFQRRSKVWRSNGYYEITASNNVIVFRETALTDLTATLTIGEYASFTLLAAEIKTQMEAVGASTYTISQDASTKKVKLASNGAGGGGLFEIIWTSTAVTQALADTLGFLTTEDDTGALTYTADELKVGTAEWIRWDFGISTNPKAFVMIGPRNSPIKITPTAVIKLQANETNNWTVPSYEKTITFNDSVMAEFSDTGLHTEELRYWRLLIEDITNANGFVELGSIFLGDVFSPARGAVQFPLSAEYIDTSRTIFSEGGQTFSDERQKSESFSLDIEFLTTADKESIDSIFIEVGTSKPFFVVLDPDNAYSSTQNYMTRYVKFVSPPQWSLERPGIFSCRVNLREEL